MNTLSRIYRPLLAASALIVLCGLGACAAQSPKNQTPEQIMLQEFVNQCSMDASNMTDGPKNSSNPFWNGYFEMCMSTNGYTYNDYKNLWY